MAFYPCSNHHAPYRGPSAAAYPAIVDGSTSNRRHLRLCQPCFGDYLDTVAEVLHEVDFDGKLTEETPGQPLPDVCAFCGSDSPSLGCFVTAYPSKEPERAFHGRCCQGCEERAIAALLLS